MGAEESRPSRRETKPRKQTDTKTIKQTGAKRRANGQFCGNKGKICGAIGCGLCWAWFEENKDGTLKLNSDLLSKLDKKDRAEFESANEAIAILNKKQTDGKVNHSLEQAIAVLQCDLAVMIEDVLWEMGMENATPPDMMDKIGKFAKAKSATDTIIVLSPALRKSMTPDQLKTFDTANREHKAIQIAYERPTEALPEIRMCTYLILFAFAHQNGFDFKQDPMWPKPKPASKKPSKPQTATAKKKATKQKR